MRTHSARSIVAVVAVSVLCGCSSGGGKSWSMASLNPFKSSSKALAKTTAPPFKKPSASANPADSLPSASEYTSTSGGSTPSFGAYSQQPAARSGYNSIAPSGYQSGQSSYSSIAPSSSTGYSALPGSSPTVSPQHGYYGPPADYSTASRSNSSAPGYSYSGTSSPSDGSAYRSTSGDEASAGSDSSYGQTDSSSRYATGSERWGTSGSTASGYDYSRSSAAGSNPPYPSSSSSALPWSATSPVPTDSTSNGSLPYGGGTGSYSPATSADRYASSAGYLSDSTPSSSFRDRYASAAIGASPKTEPAPNPGERAAYVPGQTGYAPGGTGYNPPGTSPYQPPTEDYTTPGYSPGSTDRYRPGSSSGLRPMGTYPSSSSGSQGSSQGYKLPLSG